MDHILEHGERWRSGYQFCGFHVKDLRRSSGSLNAILVANIYAAPAARG
jgi:hypothetical protein